MREERNENIINAIVYIYMHEGSDGIAIVSKFYVSSKLIFLLIHNDI